MTQLSPNEREAANRAEVTALLIRAGFRVYRPEADVHGEDLVVRDPAGLLRSVQLKSRPKVDWNRYGERLVWMLFPEPGFTLGRPWFLIEHDILFQWFEKRHSHTPKWDKTWSTPGISKDLRAFLEPFREHHWTPAGLASELDEPNGADIEFTNGGEPGVKLRRTGP